MYCNTCGQAIADQARYCSHCGHLVGHPYTGGRLERFQQLRYIHKKSSQFGQIFRLVTISDGILTGWLKEVFVKMILYIAE